MADSVGDSRHLGKGFTSKMEKRFRPDAVGLPETKELVYFFSHASQDSYTTFMREEKGLNNAGASRASIFMKVGACVGGTIIGYLSQFVGRRRAIVCAALTSAVLNPAWILPLNERSLSVSGFFMQFFAQGA